MKRPFIVFVEGQDRVGKTSVVLSIHEAREYVDNVFDRGPMSNMIYNKKNKRQYSYADYLYNIKQINRHLILYLVADENAIINRTEESGETVNRYEIRTDAILFEQCYEMLLRHDVNIFKIDTTRLNQDQVTAMGAELIHMLDERMKKYAEEFTEEAFI